MNDNYFQKREIIAQFPPANEKEKNPIVSIFIPTNLFHFLVRFRLRRRHRCLLPLLLVKPIEPEGKHLPY